jgi:hypothetical protein
MSQTTNDSTVTPEQVAVEASDASTGTIRYFPDHPEQSWAYSVDGVLSPTLPGFWDYYYA